MKELKRRGMTPASLLEDNDKSPYGLGSTETKTMEEGNEGFTSRNGGGIFTGFDDRNQVDQRARSMALNSEGLEYFGPSFIHAGSKQVAQPTYIDPYKLLEDDRLTQSSLPRVPYSSSQ